MRFHPFSTETLLECMHNMGVDPDEPLIGDGVFRRIQDKKEKPGKKDIFYVLHDKTVCFFGHWSRLPAGITWKAKADNTLTPQETARNSEIIKQARAARARKLQEIHTECQLWCSAVFNSAPDATDDHPYLKRKGVKSYGIKIFKDQLIIPVQDMAGNIHGMQFIAPDGTKRFRTGTNKSGNFYGMGEAKDKTLCIAEGYATAASVHQATGYPVLVAFDAGNLRPVATIIKSQFPYLKIIICADDDQCTIGNPGLTKATEAARAVNGLLAIPTYKEGYHGKIY